MSVSSVSPLTPAESFTARERHARLLTIAAARRLRAAERMGVQRHEDAAYWKAAAPNAVRTASALREERSFQPLPD